MEQRLINVLGSLALIVLICGTIFAVAEGVARMLIEDPYSFGMQKSMGPLAELNWEKISVGSGMARAKSQAYAEHPWAVDYVKEEEKYNSMRSRYTYDPFGLWAPKSDDAVTSSNSMISTNKLGYRSTLGSGETEDQKPVRNIFFLGGSTMAGDGLLRDRDLIPSLVCEMLNAANTRYRFVCKNFAVSGYSSTNEVLGLTGHLKAGRIPDVVVSYTGINDVWYSVVLNQPHFKGAMFTALIEGTIRTEPYERIRYRLLQMVLDGSVLLRWALNRQYVIQPVSAYRVETPSFDPDHVAERIDATAMTMVENYKHLRKLGQAYGFKYITLLQPHMFSGQKPLTEEETGLSDRILDVVPILPSIFKDTYKTVLGIDRQNPDALQIFDLTTLFDEVSSSIFVDFMHVSPTGNKHVAQKITDILHTKVP